MKIKVKWNCKEAAKLIGTSFVVKGFSIENGKGFGEIESTDHLSDDILGEVLNSSCSIISLEDTSENSETKIPSNENSEIIVGEETEEIEETNEASDDSDDLDDSDEGIMVLAGGVPNTQKAASRHISATAEMSTKEETAPQIIRNNSANNQKKQAFRRDYIRSIDELYEELDLAARTKNSSIITENILNTRDRMIAEEQKAKDEAIDIPAWIVNKKYASLTINDIGLGVHLNSPIDLSRYSARKLKVSRDLKSFLEKKLIELISPQEAADIFNNNNTTTIDFNELGQTKSRKQALQEIRSGKFDSRFSDGGNFTPEEHIYDQEEDNSIDLTNDIYMRAKERNGPNKINGKVVQKQNQRQNKTIPSNISPKFKPIRPMSEM